ncbi:hypothetical protein [Falsiporphyromonas endometrii]|uniref:Internalin-J n=1 Tax=Falsiporphyromonas endometrii TaxID=1387297 RepID=A0ABV9K4Q9_9PORP
MKTTSNFKQLFRNVRGLFTVLSVVLFFSFGYDLRAENVPVGVVKMKTKAAIGSKVDVNIATIDESIPTLEGLKGEYKKGYVTYEVTNQDITITGKISELTVSFMQLESLDLSEITTLNSLDCSVNELKDLDVSANKDLEFFDCFYNKLTNLDLRQNKNLKYLSCSLNQLTQINLDECKNLSEVSCFLNKLSKDEVSKLISSLPDLSDLEEASMDDETIEPGRLTIINSSNPNIEEENVCLNTDVAKAHSKFWQVYDYNSNNVIEYDGEGGPIADENFVLKLKTNLKPGEKLILEMTPYFNARIEGVEGDFVDGYHEYKVAKNEVTVYGKLKEFISYSGEQISEIDFSKSNALKSVWLAGSTKKENVLKSLSFTDMPRLKTLVLNNNNKLDLLKVENCKRLNNLHFSNCKLSNVKFSNVPVLSFIECFQNQMKGAIMSDYLNALPDLSDMTKGKIFIINTKSNSEGNECNAEDLKSLRSKNWSVLDFKGGANNKEGVDYYPTSTEEVLSSNIKVGRDGSFAIISGLTEDLVSIYDMNGAILFQGIANLGEIRVPIHLLTNGMFVIKAGKKTFKLSL